MIGRFTYAVARSTLLVATFDGRHFQCFSGCRSLTASGRIGAASPRTGLRSLERTPERSGHDKERETSHSIFMLERLLSDHQMHFTMLLLCFPRFGYCAHHFIAPGSYLSKEPSNAGSSGRWSKIIFQKPRRQNNVHTPRKLQVTTDSAS